MQRNMQFMLVKSPLTFMPRQAVTVMLYTTYPDLSEGDLAKRRASLVSAVALAEVAARKHSLS